MISTTASTSSPSSFIPSATQASITQRHSAIQVCDALMYQSAVADALQNFTNKQKKVEATHRLILADLKNNNGIKFMMSALEWMVLDAEKDAKKNLNPKPWRPEEMAMYEADAIRYTKNEEAHEAVNGENDVLRKAGQSGQNAAFILHTGLRGVPTWEGLGVMSWHAEFETIDPETPLPSMANEYTDLLINSPIRPTLHADPASMARRYALRFEHLFNLAKSCYRADVAVRLSIAEYHFAQWAQSKRVEVEAAGIEFVLGDAAMAKVPTQLAALMKRHIRLNQDLAPEIRATLADPQESQRKASDLPLAVPAEPSTTAAGWLKVDHKTKPPRFELEYPLAPHQERRIYDKYQLVVYPDTCVAYYADRLVTAFGRIKGSLSMVLVPGVLKEIANQPSWVGRRVASAKKSLQPEGRWEEPTSLLKNKSAYRYSNVGRVMVPVVKDQLITHEIALDMADRIKAAKTRGVRIIPLILTLDAGFNLLMQCMRHNPSDLKLPVLTQFRGQRHVKVMSWLSEDDRNDSEFQLIREDFFWNVIHFFLRDISE